MRFLKYVFRNDFHTENSYLHVYTLGISFRPWFIAMAVELQVQRNKTLLIGIESEESKDIQFGNQTSTLLYSFVSWTSDRLINYMLSTIILGFF